MNTLKTKYRRLIPEWLQNKILKIWDKVYGVIRKLFIIFGVIYTETVKFAKQHPYMAIGAVIGLAVSIALNQVPLLGWLIGPVIALFIGLSGAYLGHLFKNPKGNILSFFYVVIDYIYNIIKAIRKYGCDDQLVIVPESG